MKIKIITIHGIPNFGSVFQSYALCEYLRTMGYSDTEIIDYNPPYFKPRSVRSIIGKLLYCKQYKSRERKFRSFVERHVPHTQKKFTSLRQLKDAGLQANVYIAGGDQLWNPYYPCGQDDAYKLTWANGKKISYATSMGQTSFSLEQLNDLAMKISDYSFVSVRESSSVPLLEKAGIHAVHAVDPVLLLEPSAYKKFIVPVDQPKYLLVYLVAPSALLDRCVEYLSKQCGLKIILCSGFSRKCRCDEFLRDPSPDEMLSYIYHADFVLSASFHATLFSIIFHKQFATLLPCTSTNERIEDLLAHAEQQARIIRSMDDIGPQMLRPIDYSETDMLLKKAKELSLAYLNSALKSCEGD